MTNECHHAFRLGSVLIFDQWLREPNISSLTKPILQSNYLEILWFYHVRKSILIYMINWSRPHLKIVTLYYLSLMQVLFFWSSYDLILVRMDFDQSVIKKNILFVSVCWVNVSTSHNMLLTFRYWYVYISVVFFFLNWNQFSFNHIIRNVCTVVFFSKKI